MSRRFLTAFAATVGAAAAFAVVGSQTASAHLPQAKSKMSPQVQLAYGRYTLRHAINTVRAAKVATVRLTRVRDRLARQIHTNIVAVLDVPTPGDITPPSIDAILLWGRFTNVLRELGWQHARLVNHQWLRSYARGEIREANHRIAVATRARAARPSYAMPGICWSCWDRVAYCESSGNWHIATGNGFSGGLQFVTSTWLAWGGGRYASEAYLASREQQIMVAERIRASSGLGSWPVCGSRYY